MKQLPSLILIYESSRSLSSSLACLSQSEIQSVKMSLKRFLFTLLCSEDSVNLTTDRCRCVWKGWSLCRVWCLRWVSFWACTASCSATRPSKWRTRLACCSRDTHKWKYGTWLLISRTWEFQHWCDWQICHYFWKWVWGTCTIFLKGFPFWYRRAIQTGPPFLAL